MRLAFWRAERVKAAVQRAVPKSSAGKSAPAPAVSYTPAIAVSDSGDLDPRALERRDGFTRQGLGSVHLSAVREHARDRVPIVGQHRARRLAAERGAERARIPVRL